MRKQQFSSLGRTTLELMAVIAILGTVAAGVYSMASTTMTKRRTVNTIYQIHNIASTVQDAFSWTDSYVVNNTGDSVYGSTSYTNIQSYLVGENILSEKDLTLASGSDVTIGSIAAVAATATQNGTPSYFTLSFSADKDICQAVALEDWSARLVSAQIGDNIYELAADSDNRPPLDVSLALSLCPKGATRNIVLTFR